MDNNKQCDDTPIDNYLQYSGKSNIKMENKNIILNEDDNIKTINIPIINSINKKFNIEKEIVVDENLDNNNNFGEIIEVTDVKVIKNYENKINREMFMRIMENDLLRDIPVNLQNNKMIQEDIRKKVEKIYNIKEKGEKILIKEKEDGHTYIESLELIKNGFFDKIKWVYPIVLDQKVIYSLKCIRKKIKDKNKLKYDDNDDNDDDDDEDDIKNKGEVPYGDKMEDQLEQFKEINSLYIKRSKGEINISSFLNGLNTQQESYKPPLETYWDNNDTPKAKKIKLLEYAELYRYINILNKKKNRIGKGTQIIPLSYPEKKEKVESYIDNIINEKKSLNISGETIYIVGFLFIPYSDDKNEDEIKILMTEALDRKIILNEKNMNIKIELDKTYLLLFDNSIDRSNNFVNQDEYMKMLNIIIPTSDEVTDHILKNNKELDIYDYDKQLKKWGYNIRNISHSSWQKAREIINKNSILPISKSIKDINVVDYNKKCKIEGDDLLRDSQYYSKLMKIIYHKDLGYTTYISNEYGKNICELQRINKLFETDDNGSFYYTYSFFNLIDNLNTDKNKLKRLQQIKTKLLGEKNFNRRLNKSNNSFNILKINEEIDILKIEEKFDILKIKDKFIKNLSKISNSKKKLKDLENIIEQITKNIKNNDNKNTKIKKILQKEASLVILHYFGSIISKLDKNKISDAQLGKIMYEKQELIGKSKNFNRRLNNFISTINEEIPDVLKLILKQINQTGSFSNKKQILYSIIQLDGIIINKFVYSIFYGKPLICGHWYYLLMVDTSDNEKDRSKWFITLLSIYGDNSLTDKDEDTCIICGASLGKQNFIISSDIPSWNIPPILTDIKNEESIIFYRHSMPLNTYDIITENIKNCDSDEFKSFLKSRKIVEKSDIDKIYSACRLIIGIMSKMDINIPPRHFIELVIQCFKESRKIPNFEKYYNEKIEEIRIQRKLSSERGKKLELNQKLTDKLQISYIGYFMVRYGTLILAHLLWYMRTTIPQHLPGVNSLTSCSFFGFNGDDGFDYFVCIVVEMKILTVNIKIKGNTINDIISKNTIIKNFRYWVNSLEPNYKNALIQKNNYEKDNELYNIRVGNSKLDIIKNSIDWTDIKSVGDINQIKNNFIFDLKNILKNGDVKKYNELYNNIIFEIKKRTFKIKFFLDNFINNTSTVKFKINDTEVTCCEQLNENIVKYINYFLNINEDIVKLSKDILQLQKSFNTINNCLITTTFIFCIKKNIINKINIPFNSLDVPDSFINMAFNVYCHDGQSTGEYHSFENQNIPVIIRCIKCGWFLNKLKDTVFSRESFVNLIDIVYKKTLVDYTLFKKPKKTLDLINLKREISVNKINENIDKIATKISRLVKSDEKEISNQFKNEKNLFNYIKNFFHNIDNFKNFIPDADINSSDKEKVETIIMRNNYAIKKMKEYINEYLRKNISRIKNGYRTKTNINISLLSKKDEEKWQNILIDKNKWLENFLTVSNSKLFKKFKFNYTIDNIDNIIGRQQTYDKTYKYFIKGSKFDLTNALDVLKTYMIKEMLLFLDLAGSGEPILAEFYINIIDKINNDRNIINLSNNDITKWKDTMTEDNTLIRIKYFDILKDEEAIFNTPYKKFTDDIYNDPIFNQIKTSNDIEEEDDKNEREDDLKEKILSDIENDISDQYVDTSVRDLIEDEMEEEEIMNEIYDDDIINDDDDDDDDVIKDEDNSSLNEILNNIKDDDNFQD